MWRNYHLLCFFLYSYTVCICLRSLLLAERCQKWTFSLAWNRHSYAHMWVLCQFLQQDHPSMSFWRLTGASFIFSVSSSSLRWLLQDMKWCNFKSFQGKKLLWKSVWWTSYLVINFDCFSTVLSLWSPKCFGNDRSVFTITDYAINSWWHSGNSSVSNIRR